MSKKAIIVTALGGFVRSFLTNDILILQEMGYQVHCAANNNHPGGEGLNEYFKSHNVFFHQVDFSSSAPISKKTLVSYKQMKEVLKSEKFDVIHCHTPIAAAICRWAARKNRKCGAKVIYTSHGFYFHQGSSKKSWIVFGNVEKIMSIFTDAIITINMEDYNNAKKMYAKEVFYIPGIGVNTKKYRECIIDRDEYRKKIGVKKEDFLVLAVGELSQRKNHKIIIDALSICNIPNIVFMICGNSMTNTNTVTMLKALAEKQNIDLRLMGLRGDIPQLCKCANVGVMPSLREGLGLSGIEMLASGLPIVASCVHGILDYVVDGENGYLANPNSADEFAEGIMKCYGISDKIEFSKNCMNSVMKFDSENSIAAIKEYYNKLLN